MSNVGQIERATQNRVVKLFRDQLGYQYLGNWEERVGNSNIEEDVLRTFLVRQGYSESLINRALYELQKVAGDQTTQCGRYPIGHRPRTPVSGAVRVRPPSAWSSSCCYSVESMRGGRDEVAEEEMVDRHRAEPLAAWLTPVARSALGESTARHSHEKESIGRRHPLTSGAARRSACCPAPGRVPSHARSAGIGSAAGRAHYIGVIN
jgi:hypothetical protein